MNKRFGLFLGLALFTLFSGCDVHEMPDNNAVDPTLIEVNITLSIDIQFPTDTIFQTYASTQEGDYDIRYIVDIYDFDPNEPNSAGNRVQRLVQTEESFPAGGMYDFKDTLKLPAKEYQIITWIDYVDKGTNTDKYYNTQDLHSVSIIVDGQYQGYSVTRDAFTAKKEMDLTPYRGQRYVHYSAELETMRPFAIYQIITTDIEAYNTYHQSSYAPIQPAQTNIQYNLFFPMGYNTYLQTPIGFQTGVNYTYDIIEEVVPAQEAIIASDYVFVSDDTFYMIDFQIFSTDGKLINTISGLKIPLRQNAVTILRDEFLTKDLNNGNTGVNDQFDDEIIIYI